jgi:hypothetical protein
MSEDAIKEYECSDKIYVHMETFSNILGNSNSGELVILEMRSLYDLGLPIAVTIGGFHSDSDKNIIYCPCWIIEHIGCMDYALSDDKTMCEVSLKRNNPSFCSKITIQPFESKLASYDDPENALRNGLEKYTCIYANSTINILMPDNYVLKFSVYDCEPKKSDEPLCIRDVEILVNLLPAKDIKLPIPEAQEKEKKEEMKEEMKPSGGAGTISHESESTFHGYTKFEPKTRSVGKFAPKGYVPFGGVGHTLGGSEKSNKESKKDEKEKD